MSASPDGSANRDGPSLSTLAGGSPRFSRVDEVTNPGPSLRRHIVYRLGDRHTLHCTTRKPNRPSGRPAQWRETPRRPRPAACSCPKISGCPLTDLSGHMIDFHHRQHGLGDGVRVAYSRRLRTALLRMDQLTFDVKYPPRPALSARASSREPAQSAWTLNAFDQGGQAAAGPLAGKPVRHQGTIHERTWGSPACRDERLGDARRLVLERRMRPLVTRRDSRPRGGRDRSARRVCRMAVLLVCRGSPHHQPLWSGCQPAEYGLVRRGRASVHPLHFVAAGLSSSVLRY